MEPIILERTEDTPKVHFDKANKIFLIHGESLPEDAASFYDPLISWFEKYVDEPETETIVDIFLEYINSSSIKRIFSILCLLEEIEPYHNTILIKWSHKKGDDLMREKGLEFSEYLEVPVELVEV